jgi:predicted nucleic acid-binding protein
VSVLVDSTIWSLAMRRQRVATEYADELKRLDAQRTVLLLGAVRQEVLSGLSSPERFVQLQRTLRGWPNYPVITEHYELAADLSNQCRRRGVQGSTTDFLLCAVAVRDGHSVFTTDLDFDRYAALIPVMLHEF